MHLNNVWSVCGAVDGILLQNIKSILVALCTKMLSTVCLLQRKFYVLYRGTYEASELNVEVDQYRLYDGVQ